MRAGASAIAVILLALGWAGPSPGDALSGRARLVDADTIEIAGIPVRLHGIDAPESYQSCEDADGRPFQCGVHATETLRRLIGDGAVACQGSDRDRYGRLIGTCSADGVELNREMVRLGMAYAYEEYSDAYLPEQIDALKDDRGLWAGTFRRPSHVRAERRQAAPPTAPVGCAIKGNISDNGRIYHAPWSDWYDRTRIDTTRGERWFCSEEEAIAAGWRAAWRQATR